MSNVFIFHSDCRLRKEFDFFSYFVICFLHQEARGPRNNSMLRKVKKLRNKKKISWLNLNLRFNQLSFVFLEKKNQKIKNAEMPEKTICARLSQLGLDLNLKWVDIFDMEFFTHTLRVLLKFHST